MGMTVAVTVLLIVVGPPYSLLEVVMTGTLEVDEEEAGTGTMDSLMYVATEVFRNVATEVPTIVTRDVMLTMEFWAASVLAMVVTKVLSAVM